VENKSAEPRSLEIHETEEDKNLSIGQLKYKYLQIAKQEFQGKVFINSETGRPIKVSKDGLMEWWRKSRKREHIISIQLLGFFLENSCFTGESPDYLGRRKIISASQFESKCTINGKDFLVNITTRKAMYDIDKLRYYSLKNMRPIQ
jgi:hypothetical protein